MGKKNKDQAQPAAGTAAVPEFHIVVKRPSRHGPLAPYRFAICVAVAIVISFGDLRAMLGGVPADTSVLTRAIAVGVFTWVVLTIVNKILAHGLEDDAPADTPAEAAASNDATTPYAA